MDKSALYVPPPREAYSLLKPFDMTLSNKPVWAIALSTKQGMFVNASLSVVYTLMFSWLWGLIAAAVIYFAPHSFSRRRLVALVALRNSSDPWSALLALGSFTYDSAGWFRPSKRGQPSTWRDSLFGLIFVILSLAIVVASIALGVFGPFYLQVGKVAPVVSAKLYYPRASAINNSAVVRDIRGDISLRALSSVDVFGDTIMRNIRLEPDNAVINSSTDEEPMYGLTYGYTITGPELGLKRASDLTLKVSGACRTEYKWLNDTSQDSNTTSDFYILFGDPDNNFTANLNEPYISLPPTAAFQLPFDAINQAKAGNVSYAVVTTIAHRKSRSEGKTDPWYLTEPLTDDDGDEGEGDDQDPPQYKYRIRSKRPALSCWHQDTWSCCGGQSITGGYNLSNGNLTGLKVPAVLLDVLGTSLLYPTVQKLGSDAAIAALDSVSSSWQSREGVIDAAYSSISRDMEHLIMASYISTLNTLGDTTRLKRRPPSDPDGIRTNRFYNKTTQLLADGADDFVVVSPDVMAFNLTGLITFITIAATLLALRVILLVKLTRHGNIYARLPHKDDMDPNLDISPFNKDRWARFKAFSAVHLLRNTYEKGTGVPEDDWKCSESLPEPSDEKPLRLVRCGLRGESDCAGHITTDPILLGLGRQQKRKRRGHNPRVNSLSTLLGGDRDSDATLYNKSDDPFKNNTTANVTVTPLPGYHTPYHGSPGENDMWSSDIQMGAMNHGTTAYYYTGGGQENPYFPQSFQTAPNTQQYQDNVPLNFPPFVQQTHY